MKRLLSILSMLAVTSLLSGCVVTKTPNTNEVTIPTGEQVKFSVVVFPPTATFAWTLDGKPLPNTGSSYVYTAQGGEHFLTVRAMYILGTDTQTWHIQTTFNKTYGGSEQDEAYAVQQTSDGGYILAGRTHSFGAGDWDVWLIKTDENGNEQWNKTFGSAGVDWAQSVQQTTDGGYILAGITYSFGAGSADVWLIKTDENGNKGWDTTFGGSNEDWAYAVQQTSDGGYILTGRTHSFGAGSADVWLIKTDANGIKGWEKTFGGGSDDEANAAQQTSDGGYILAGRTHSFGAGVGDVWLIKTDANGNKAWDKTFGGSDYDIAYAVQQTSDGGYILAGYTSSFGAGVGDAWLIKTDANGNKVWDKTFGGSNNEVALAVKQTSDGGYILAGCTYSGDAWLIKTDVNGNKVWDRTFGGSMVDVAYAVQQTSDGGYILAGRTDSFRDTSNGDAWLIKTDAEGNAPATPTP